MKNTNRIYQIRSDLCYTIKEFAHYVHVSERAIENWETYYNNLSVDSLIRIAQKTGYSLGYILGIDEKIRLDISWMNEKEAAHLIRFLDDMKKMHDLLESLKNKDKK